MSNAPMKTLAWAAGVVLVAWSSGNADADSAPDFAPPVRIKAGDAWLGADRLYPSPVLHDIDGDGRRDVLVGDLFGRVTMALTVNTEDGGTKLAAETPLLDRRGEELIFHNW